MPEKLRSAPFDFNPMKKNWKSDLEGIFILYSTMFLILYLSTKKKRDK